MVLTAPRWEHPTRLMSELVMVGAAELACGDRALAGSDDLAHQELRGRAQCRPGFVTCRVTFGVAARVGVV